MRTRWTRALAKVTLAAVLVAGIFALSGVVSHGRFLPTAFAANCYTNGTTLETVNINDLHGYKLGTVEIRWSATCGTNWSRVTTTVSASRMCAQVFRNDGAQSAYYCVNGSFGPGFQIFSDSIACANNKCMADGEIYPTGNYTQGGGGTGWH